LIDVTRQVEFGLYCTYLFRRMARLQVDLVI